MIPKLRPDGTLPPGTYQATIDEVLVAYPPINEQRQILNDSLQRVVEELHNVDPSLVIYLDGSYITRKAEPNDLDLLIISRKSSALDLVQLLDQVCPVEAVSVDITVEPSMPNVVFDLFTETRRGQSKGILLII